MWDHHKHILRTSTKIETLASYLGYIYDDKRGRMNEENLKENTGCFLGLKNRSSDERTTITTRVRNRYYGKFKRHGFIDDKRYLKKRKHKGAKAIAKMEKEISSVWKVPIKIPK